MATPEGASRASLREGWDESARGVPWMAIALAGPITIAVGIAIYATDRNPGVLMVGLAATMVLLPLRWFVSESLDLSPFLWGRLDSAIVWGTLPGTQVSFRRDGSVILDSPDFGHLSVDWNRLSVDSVRIIHKTPMSWLSRGVRGEVDVVFQSNLDGKQIGVPVSAKGCADWRVEYLINASIRVLGGAATFSQPGVLDSILTRVGPTIPWPFRPLLSRFGARGPLWPTAFDADVARAGGGLLGPQRPGPGTVR